MNIIEKYQSAPGQNTTFQGYPMMEKNVQDDITACKECLAVRNAFDIRTDYDKYYLNVYNNKAFSFSTNLLSLQFPK